MHAYSSAASGSLNSPPESAASRSSAASRPRARSRSSSTAVRQALTRERGSSISSPRKRTRSSTIAAQAREAMRQMTGGRIDISFYGKGSLCFVPDEGECWLPATVQDTAKPNIVYATVHGMTEIEKFTTDKIMPMEHDDDMDDMAGFNYLNEASILHNVRARYSNDDIYTYTGPILIAVNPFKHIPLYKTSDINYYKKRTLAAKKPHVFGVADKAYVQMRTDQRSQSMIISGESGAGKTETTKLILRYLTAISNSLNLVTAKVQKRILDANPILEAFGNAKTLRNNNSSRFGKFMKIFFDVGEIVGATVNNYLLEKVRVIHQQTGERNYHVFYQLCKGATPELRERLQLLDPSAYHYLSQSGCVEIDSVDDEKEFETLLKSMATVGFTDDEQFQVMSVLSGLLRLGNLSFVELPNDASDVAPGEDADICASLLGIDANDLKKTLCNRSLYAGGQWYKVPLTPQQAMYTRDALAKSLYSSLFDWLVMRINLSIRPESQDLPFIGVLDIFGFEVFDSNSFEQFCINFTNEKLQQLFNNYVFKLELAEYKKENINAEAVEFTDNQICLDLIEKPPHGIMQMLDEECVVPKGSDESLLHKLHQAHGRHSHYVKPRRMGTSFTVKHYAGDVEYDTTGFLDKNKDKIHDDLKTLIESSSLHVVKEVLELTHKSRTAVEDSSKASPDKAPGRRSVKRDPTLGSQFRKQLQHLMVTMESTDPHYIRCIRPNSKQEPDSFHSPSVQHQLRYSGVLESIRVRRAGFPQRSTFEEFVKQFHSLAPEISSAPSHRAHCAAIIKSLGLDANLIQLGRTKVFLRWGQLAVLENMVLKQQEKYAVVIQAAWKGVKCRRRYLRMRQAAIDIQRMMRGHLARKETEGLVKELRERMARAARERAERQAREEEERRLAAARAEQERLEREAREKAERQAREAREAEERRLMQAEEEYRRWLLAERKRLEEIRLAQELAWQQYELEMMRREDERMQSMRAEERRIRAEEEERRRLKREAERLERERIAREQELERLRIAKEKEDLARERRQMAAEDKRMKQFILEERRQRLREKIARQKAEKAAQLQNIMGMHAEDIRAARWRTRRRYLARKYGSLWRLRFHISKKVNTWADVHAELLNAVAARWRRICRARALENAAMEEADLYSRAMMSIDERNEQRKRMRAVVEAARKTCGTYGVQVDENGDPLYDEDGQVLHHSRSVIGDHLKEQSAGTQQHPGVHDYNRQRERHAKALAQRQHAWGTETDNIHRVDVRQWLQPAPRHAPIDRSERNYRIVNVLEDETFKHLIQAEHSRQYDQVEEAEDKMEELLVREAEFEEEVHSARRDERMSTLDDSTRLAVIAHGEGGAVGGWVAQEEGSAPHILEGMITRATVTTPRKPRHDDHRPMAFRHGGLRDPEKHVPYLADSKVAYDLAAPKRPLSSPRPSPRKGGASFGHSMLEEEVEYRSPNSPRRSKYWYVNYREQFGRSKNPASFESHRVRDMLARQELSNKLLPQLMDSDSFANSFMSPRRDNTSSALEMSGRGREDRENVSGVRAPHTPAQSSPLTPRQGQEHDGYSMYTPRTSRDGHECTDSDSTVDTSMQTIPPVTPRTPRGTPRALYAAHATPESLLPPPSPRGQVVQRLSLTRKPKAKAKAKQTQTVNDTTASSHAQSLIRDSGTLARLKLYRDRLAAQRAQQQQRQEPSGK